MTVLGHDAAIAAFRAAALGDCLHHAWLVTGPRGIGKARFAEAAAAWLLARAVDPAADLPGLEVPPDHRVARLLEVGSHPDYRRLARLPKERSEELARSITVDQVRALHPLFATTASLSPRRVVLIDAIDELERSGANALLKSLEEPPAGTIFLLVSHAPGRLLPTIRSRCRVLRLGRLDAAATRSVLRAALPTIDDGEIAALAAIAAGAPGAAMRFAGLDVAALEAAIDRLATDGDPTNARRSTLAHALSSKAAQPRYEAFLDRAPARIAAAARAEGADLAATTALWARARRIADGALGLSMDPQLTVFELAGLVAELAPQGAGAKA